MASLATTAKPWYRNPPLPWAFMAALLGFGMLVGIVAAPSTRAEPTYEARRQQTLAEAIGWPDGWIIADGPIEPGGTESHRTETWFYAETSIAVRFVDGAEVLPVDEIDGSQVHSRSEVKPTAFHRGMDLKDVEERLGERGTRIEPFESPYPESEGFIFIRSALLITTLNGRFFTAQTY